MVRAAGLIVSVPLTCVMTSLIFSATQGFGLTTRPVTYAMITIIGGTLYAFLIALITFFAGVLVWDERDARTDEVNDALPVPEWPAFVAKFITLITAIATIQGIVMLVAILVSSLATHRYIPYLRPAPQRRYPRTSTARHAASAPSHPGPCAPPPAP